MRSVSASYFVRYEGQAENPEAFLSHYRTHHVPLLIRFPRLRRIVLHVPSTWRDPYPVTPDRFSLLVQMDFDSLADLETAVGSEARAAARRDFQQFPPFQGDVYHQAAISEEVFSQ